jgi:alkylated DNA repair dioxygenase AlkB
MSIVKNAEIFLDSNLLTPSRANKLLKLLNDDAKFERHSLHFYNQKTQQVKSVGSWRVSYWLGEYAQAVQTCNKTVIDIKTGETKSVPTDYVKPYEFPDEILELKHKIEKKYGVEFNSCLVGKFEDPDDKIGFHSDASDSMGEDPYIGSVSLGRTRDFQIQSKDKTENKTVKLKHGDVLVMRENANRNYKHAVPKDPGCNKQNFRLNLTFRNYQYCDEEKQYEAQPF